MTMRASPPPAAAPLGWVSGHVTVPPGLRGTRPSPAQLLDVVRGNWTSCQPRSVMLGNMPAQVENERGEWPPSAPATQGGASFACGIVGYDDLGAAIVGADNYSIACVLEWGHGASSSRAYFDWVPGSYNLPPCSYVNVQCLPWGALFGLDWPAQDFAAAIAPGNQDGAHVPTVSGVFTLASAVRTLNLYKPNHSRGFDVFPRDAEPAAVPHGQLVLTGAVNGLRDFGANAYAPGWSPLDVEPGTRVCSVKLVSGASLTFGARWYLQL